MLEKEINEKTEIIKRAIEEVMEIPFEEWAESRERKRIICQQLYVHCIRNMNTKIPFKVISYYLRKKTHSATSRLEKNYYNDYETNKEFRKLADKVDEILKEKGIFCTFAP
jgi:uncharacterized membrane protein YheB (UPF0754 family)